MILNFIVHLNFLKFKKIEIEMLILTIFNGVCFFKAGFLETVSSLELESMTLFLMTRRKMKHIRFFFFLVLVDLSPCLDDIIISLSFSLFTVSAIFWEVDAELLFVDLN